MNRVARRADRAQSRRSDPKPTLVEAAGRSLVKLDLGCGLAPKEGFEGVDLYGDKAKHKVDLFKFPWPFESESIEEIHCSHLCEHIPAREIEERDIATWGTTWSAANSDGGPVMRERREKLIGQDMFFAFMDECYRILKPEAWMMIVVPSGRSNRAFWDPTHRRFFMQETFLYLAEEWRRLNKLEHYRVSTNFGVDVGHTMPQEEGLRSAEAQATRIMHYWNTTVDWIAKIKKMPRMPPAPVAAGG